MSERNWFASSAWGLDKPPIGEEAKHFLSFLAIIFEKEEGANGWIHYSLHILCISIVSKEEYCLGKRNSFASSPWGLDTPPTGEEAKHLLSCLTDSSWFNLQKGRKRTPFWTCCLYYYRTWSRRSCLLPLLQLIHSCFSRRRKSQSHFFFPSLHSKKLLPIFIIFFPCLFGRQTQRGVS